MTETAANNIRATIGRFFPHGGVVEIRAFNGRGKEPAWVGYFDDTEKLIEMILPIDGDVHGIYFVPDVVDTALLARCANRLAKGIPATSDANVIRRTTFKIDLDPVRPSGVSSTDAEKAAARKRLEEVVGFLHELGFPEPFKGDSGNGYHAIYSVDLPNTPENTDLIKKCLQALDQKFSDASVHVDTSTFNAARIWKLYGTQVRKGDSTKDRPHRRCAILSLGSDAVVPRSLLETLASYAEHDEQPRGTKKPAGSTALDLREWLGRYGGSLPSFTEKSKAGASFFAVFDVCPFDPSHVDRSACIGQMNNGALFAFCKHESCGGGRNRWRELRERYEPNVPPQGAYRQPRPPVPRDEPASVPASVLDDALLQRTIFQRCTNAMAAEFFRELRSTVALYCYSDEGWYIWNDRYWERDQSSHVTTLFLACVKEAYPFALALEEERRRMALRHLIQLEDAKEIRDVLSLARTLPGMKLPEEQFNPDRSLFNVQNGTIDLATGECRPFRREDLITRMSRFTYEKGAMCPRWEKHVALVLNGNQEWIETLQQVLGVSLLGSNPDQLFSIFWGSGNNGKTTLLLVLRHLMGDYGATLSPDSLSRARYEKSGSDHRTDRLCLKHARLVISEEAQQGRALDMSLMKAVTGGTPIKVRGAYAKREEEFVPGGVICYAVNHRPVIPEQTKAAWRRVLLWMCTATVPSQDRIEHYESVLIGESAGILNWLLEGLQKWVKAGRRLAIPDSLRAAIDEYRREENPLQEWMDTALEARAGAWTSFKDLYNSYYAAIQAEYPEEESFKENLTSKKKFSSILGEFYEPARHPKTRDRGFDGVILRGAKASIQGHIGGGVTDDLSPIQNSHPVPAPRTDDVSDVENSLTRAHRGEVPHRTDELSDPTLQAHPSSDSDPLASLRRYLERYHIRDIPDLTKYRRITGTKLGRCIFAGCMEAKSWEDHIGLNYLCNTHFEYIKGKLTEAAASRTPRPVEEVHRD